MSGVTKSIIWAELETLEFAIKLAKKNLISDTHPFMLDLLQYKARIEEDLVQETE